MVYFHDKVLNRFYICDDYIYLFDDKKFSVAYGYSVSQHTLNYRTFYRRLKVNNAVKVTSQDFLNSLLSLFVEKPYLFKAFNFSRYTLWLDGYVKIKNFF